jgi:hypothetical protein
MHAAMQPVLPPAPPQQQPAAAVAPALPSSITCAPLSPAQTPQLSIAPLQLSSNAPGAAAALPWPPLGPHTLSVQQQMPVAPNHPYAQLGSASLDCTKTYAESCSHVAIRPVLLHTDSQLPCTQAAAGAAAVQEAWSVAQARAASAACCTALHECLANIAAAAARRRARAAGPGRVPASLRAAALDGCLRPCAAISVHPLPHAQQQRCAGTAPAAATGPCPCS